MFHAPTTESKQQNEASRGALKPERAHEISPPVSIFAGYSWSGAADGAAPPASPLPNPRQQIMRLHSMYGNQAVLRMLSHSTPTIQTKLTINQPGDPFEREADRVADQVMRITAPPAIQRKCSACAEEEKLQCQCTECQEEDKKEIRRKETNAGPQVAPPIVHDVLRSPGQPLDPATRAFMEPRFGYDFSDVRIHTDEKASESAAAVSASAYTVGQNVAFGSGKYVPQSESGRRLIAHELAHVVQQSGSQPTLQAQGGQMNPKEDNITAGFTCGDSEMQDPGFDNSKSCCDETTLKQLKAMVPRVYNALAAAVERAEAGASVDSLLRKHFGWQGPSQRATIIGNIEKTLGVALEYLPKHTFLCRQVSQCPEENVLAFSTHGSNITVCEREIKDEFWEIILHEMFHVSGVANLPDYKKADEEKRKAGEFETYYSEDPAGSENPAFKQYPSSAPLRNADSYKKFVLAISAPNFSNESVPARFAPSLEAGAGAMLPGWQPLILARLTFTPLGESVLHFITPGVVGIFMPKLGVVPATDPNAAQPRGYAGTEVGAGVVTGPQLVTGVFDLTGGVGAVWTRGRSVDFGALVRASAGLRVGTPAVGASLNAYLGQIHNFAVHERRDDWILGLSARGHWGGQSKEPH